MMLAKLCWKSWWKALLRQAFLPEGLSPATFAKLKLVKVEAVLNLCLEGCLLQAVLLEVLSQGFAKLKLIKVQAAIKTLICKAG